MKKTILFIILLILPLLTFSFVSAQQSQRPGTVNKKMDLVCLQKAVEKRETAIIAAHDQLSAAIKNALETRKIELIKAWVIENRFERNKARIKTWNNFRKAKREAKKTYNTSIKNIWKEFHQETQNCQVNTQGVEPEANDYVTVE